MSARFATSSKWAMRPMAYQGITAISCYPQLRAFLTANTAFLKDRGAPEAADLLAEPMPDQAGTIDWYAEGAPVPLTDLAPEEQARVRARLDACTKAVTALADSDAGRKNAMAAALIRQALLHPDDSDIYALDGRPMLINWGFAKGAQNSGLEDIMRSVQAPPPPPQPEPEPEPEPEPAPVPEPAPAPAPEPEPAPMPIVQPPAEEEPEKKGFSLPRWLLILLGLLLLLLLLLALLGIIPGLLPSGCSRTDQPVPAPAVQEQSAGEPKAPAEPAPKEEAPAASGEQMNIPEEAAKANDLSFLEGCWRSNTGLVNQDGIAVTTEYCFDARGEGTRSLIETGPEGLRCSGPATARFSQDSLQIEAEEAVCSDNRNTYVGQSVVCTGSGSATICSGREKSSNNSWQAGFVRR